MKLTIRRRTQSQWLQWFIGFFPLVCQFLVVDCHFPSAIRYSLDLALLALAALNVHRMGWAAANRKAVGWAALFLLYAVVNYLFHYQSALYFLWGLRNNFRFYLYFLLSVLVLREDDPEGFYSLFDRFLVLNTGVVSWQYWVCGISQDRLGGLFGTAVGSNGYMNIFLVILSARAAVAYLNRKKSLWFCLWVFGSSVYIAALAEVKFFFAELLIILAAVCVLTRFSFKKLGIVLGGILLTVLGVNLLVLIFPEWKDTFSLTGFLRVAADANGYTSTGDLNRLTGIPILAQRYLKNWNTLLFGLGLGNCDYSESAAILTTPYYTRYGWLHYSWMSTTFLFLELGIVGLVFFFGFFVCVFFQAGKVARNHHERIPQCQLAQVLAIVCWGIGIYNSSLRTEAGYLVYLVLAFPFLESHRRKEEPAEFRLTGTGGAKCRNSS